MNKKNFSALSSIGRLLVNATVLLLTVFLIFKASEIFYSYAYNYYSKTLASERSYKEIIISIPDGSNMDDIADILHKNELIDDTLLFKAQAMFSNYGNSFAAGEYSLNTTMDENEIMQVISKGIYSEDEIKIIIPDGWTVAQIGKYLNDNGIVSSDVFRKAMNEGEYDYVFLNSIPNRNSRLEGYLYPDTYFIRENSSAEEIISKMLRRFDEVYNDELKTRANELGLSMDEVVIRASIIESESKIPEERFKISGVIANRVEENMNLEMKSTVLYALGKEKDNLSYTDLNIDSPYNTYKYQGLPLGPICNPSESSINAALHPEENDYLFFIVKNKDTGEHEFSATYEEFESSKKKYGQNY